MSGRTFYAFDLLMLNGRDVRALPLVERKHRLAALMPSVECRMLFLDSIAERGVDLFRLACDRDLGHRWEVGARHVLDKQATSKKAQLATKVHIARDRGVPVESAAAGWNG